MCLPGYTRAKRWRRSGSGLRCGSVSHRRADVRAALALVARGEAPLGIVYATDVPLAEGVREVAAIPADLHEPIVYPVALIAGRVTPLARRFFAFLTGPDGRAAFARAGFIVD